MKHGKHAIFLRFLLCVGVVPAVRAGDPCSETFLEICRKNIRFLQTTREMHLFHWFTTAHYGKKQKPEDYLDLVLESFLKPLPEGSVGGAAKTNGLYLATDPFITCYYGEKVGFFQKPVLAVLKVQTGSRVAFLERDQTEDDYSQWARGKSCLEVQKIFDSPIAAGCFNGIKTDLVAYGYQEAPLAGERKVFGGKTIAFTAGKEVLENKKASLQVYSMNDLKNGRSVEISAISTRVGALINCEAGEVLKKYKNPEVSQAQQEEWQKKYWLSESDSLDFFTLETAGGEP